MASPRDLESQAETDRSQIAATLEELPVDALCKAVRLSAARRENPYAYSSVCTDADRQRPAQSAPKIVGAGAPRRARTTPRPGRHRGERRGAWSDPVPCSGARWHREIAQHGLAVAQELDPAICCFTRSGSVEPSCQVSRNDSSSALSGSVPGLSVRKHQRRLS